jgi:hypothetical protein
MADPTNDQIAGVLDRIAEILEAEDENPFRVRAYRQGAQAVRYTDQTVADLARRQDGDGLTEIPNIGSGIAAVIGEYVRSGKSELLQELEQHTPPEAVLSRVPGIGPELARRIVEKLDVQTLPELEEAAHDGRLAEVEGFGQKRIEGVQASLAGLLSRSARVRQRSRTANGKTGDERPSVDLLLDIDADYRRKAEAGKLQTIAPRRFNPGEEAWLPVLHAKREGWSFTALYSNTAQAHKLGKTKDWVVIYYERDGDERQYTVVTETRGALEGKRVVRGREAENLRHYGVEAKRRSA